METQYTVNHQIGSVFGIESIPNTDFGSITPNKLNNCSHWLESVCMHSAQHIAELCQ